MSVALGQRSASVSSVQLVGSQPRAAPWVTMSGVRAVALHPGNSYTDVIRDYPLPVRIANAAIAPIWAMVTQSAADSALTSLYAVATPDPDATAGKYLERCAPVAPAKEAANEAVARRVWAMSEELVRPWM